MTERGKLAAEFVLIIVGVLIALAVDTMFKEREDDKLRAEYIARIRQDIESDKQALLHRLVFFTDVQRFSIPNHVQRRIRENCPTTDTLDEEPTGFPPCDLPGVDYQALSRLDQPLKSDEAFRRTLTYRDSELGVMRYLMTQQVNFADEVLRSHQQ
jgi:hypothetical protein